MVGVGERVEMLGGEEVSATTVGVIAGGGEELSATTVGVIAGGVEELPAISVRRFSMRELLDGAEVLVERR